MKGFWGLLQLRKYAQNLYKEISYFFIDNIAFNYPVISKFSTEHSINSDTLCAKFQNDQAVEKVIIDKQDFLRIAFRIGFWQILYLATTLWLLWPCSISWMFWKKDDTYYAFI